MSGRGALVDIVLALGLSLLGGLGAVALRGVLTGPLNWPLLSLLVLQGLLVLAGLRGLLWVRRQHWRELRLLPPTWRDGGRALLALALLFATSAAFNIAMARFAPGATEAHRQQLAGLAIQLAGGLPVFAVAAVMLFVGFYEEVLARGFLLSRCQSLLGGDWAAVVLSSLLFGLGHAYQGWAGFAQTTAAGMVLAGLTLRWGTLWPAILAHAALNTFSLLALRGPP